MIDLYYWPTPNGWKVSIMLEECGLADRTVPVDIGGGDQFKPDFLRISPNNRMPAIVDHEPHGGGAPLALFESGAILEYLADKTGRFLPRAGAVRYAVLHDRRHRHLAAGVARRPAGRRAGVDDVPAREAVGGRRRRTPRRAARPRPPQGMGRASADRGGAAATEGAPLQPDERVGPRGTRGSGQALAHPRTE
jgi:glutathione S-transferase